MDRARAYLDHNATTPMLPEAREAVVAGFELIGNPSSIHAEGRAARAAIEKARRQLADLLGAAPEHVFFTSGGTESANIALVPDVLGKGPQRCDRLMIAGGEHPCVMSGHRFPADSVQILPLTPHGVLDLDALKTALAQASGERVMLALQAANNETGVIQPVDEAADMVHAAGGIVYCDAVQVVGRIPVFMATLKADLVGLSAHKFGGPKGVGALIIANPELHIANLLVRGGGQERGLRAGTENLLGILGMGAAAETVRIALQAEAERQMVLRDEIEAIVRRVTPEAVILGEKASRLPNTCTFALPTLKADILLMALDVEGVALSSGSACSSGKVKRSQVLDSMGISDPLASGVLRVSVGRTSTKADVEIFASAFEKVVGTMKARRKNAA